MGLLLVILSEAFPECSRMDRRSHSPSSSWAQSTNPACPVLI